MDARSGSQEIDDLQFTTAEASNPSAAVIDNIQTCAACHQPITTSYYAVANAIVCPTCSARIMAVPEGSKLGRLIKAALLGTGAGLIGALIWFAVRRLASVEVGLIAILVGFMVGKAVRRGSGNQGGLGYQILAVVITYGCIAANYVPDIVEALVVQVRQENVADANHANAGDAQIAAADAEAGTPPAGGNRAGADAPPSFVHLAMAVVMLSAFVFAFALAAPFLGGLENIIGLLIIGFALWEAWKFNAKYAVPFSGPYEVTPSTAVS